MTKRKDRKKKEKHALKEESRPGRENFFGWKRQSIKPKNQAGVRSEGEKRELSKARQLGRKSRKKNIAGRKKLHTIKTRRRIRGIPRSKKGGGIRLSHATVVVKNK